MPVTNQPETIRRTRNAYDSACLLMQREQRKFEDADQFATAMEMSRSSMWQAYIHALQVENEIRERVNQFVEELRADPESDDPWSNLQWDVIAELREDFDAGEAYEAILEAVESDVTDIDVESLVHAIIDVKINGVEYAD